MTTTATRTRRRQQLGSRLVREIVRRILTVSQPEKIILFGSAATGEMTKDSDIDLLVIERELSKDPLGSVRIREALGDLGYPFDVITMDPDWYHRSKEVIGGIAYPATKYGRVIYEA